MKITLPSEKTITVRKKTITTSEIEVIRVVDLTNKKVVAAIIKGLGWVRVKDLSGDKYDNPQWTNESLTTALLAQFGS